MVVNGSLVSSPSDGYQLDLVSLGVLYLVTAVVVIICNIIVILVVVMSRELHLPTLWNLAYMALWDLCVGMHFLIFSVPSAFLDGFAYSMDIAPVAAGINTLLSGQNCFNVLLAIIDRLLAVFYPLRYMQLMNRGRFTLALVIMILLSVCRLCILTTQATRFVYVNSVALIHVKYNSTAAVSALFGLPLLIVIIILILYSILMKRLAYSNRFGINTGSPTHRQFSVTILISAVIFCLSYIPPVVVLFLAFRTQIEDIPPIVVQIGAISTLCNSLWNVIIYAITYRPFRNALCKLFCKSWYRRQRQEEIYEMFHKSPPMDIRKQENDCISTSGSIHKLRAEVDIASQSVRYKNNRANY